MFWKVICHVFVPSSGLEENNIKGTFYPGAPLALLYPIYIFYLWNLQIVVAIAIFISLFISLFHFHYFPLETIYAGNTDTANVVLSCQ